MSNHRTAREGECQTNDISVPQCRSCRSSEVSRKGFRSTKNRGKVQRWVCRKCHKAFTVDDGFFRMRYAPEAITAAIDLYFSNLSSRKVRNHYRRHEPTEMSHVTVLDWCRRYAVRVQKYIDTLTPNIVGNCYADETDIQVRTHHHRFWVSIDYGTRYINAIHYSETGNEIDATIFLKKTLKALPRYIQTDAAPFYKQAFTRAFYRAKNRGNIVEHRVNNVSKTGKHNVRIETVFSKIKDRVHDFRCLKAAWSAPILLAGVVLQHNHIEAHTVTGCIPAKLAGIDLEGRNRWLSLIRAATTYATTE